MIYNIRIPKDGTMKKPAEEILPLRTVNRKTVLLAAALLFFTVVCFELPAQVGSDSKRILIIYPYNTLSEWDMNFNNNFITEMNRNSVLSINTGIEYLGIELNPEIQFDKYLKEKIMVVGRYHSPDLILAMFPTSHHLLLENRDQIFPGVPVIYLPALPDTAETISSLPDSYAVKSSSEYAIRRTLQQMRILLPDLKHIYITGGGGKDDLPYSRLFRNIADSEESLTSISTDYLLGLPADDLFKKISDLPDNSALFYLPYNGDREGNVYRIPFFFPDYHKYADAPVFTFFDAPFGMGIVGGVMNGPSLYAKKAAEIAIRILSGEKSEPDSGSGTSIAKYDWRALKRWGISEDLLPEGSEVLYRTETFFEKYRTRIILALVLILAETSLIIALIVNLIKRKETEAELHRNRVLLERSQATALLGGWEIDPSFKHLYATGELYRIMELSRESALTLEKLKGLFNDEDRPAFVSAVSQLPEGKSFDLELRLSSIRGSEKWLRCTGSAVMKQDRITGYSGIIQDITRRKTDEMRIQKSLHEKEALLKEVHHRVKNNLAIISSLLALQADSVEDDRIRDIILTSQSRVRSMAMIHEMLYQSGNLTTISFREYMEHLIRALITDRHIEGHPVALSIDIDDFQMDLDQLVPLGIMVNEIISNSLNHAFTDIKNPEISFIAGSKEDSVNIKIRDNGSGIPELLGEPNQSGSVGLLLIHSLSRQLKADISTDSENGTEYSITFLLNR